MPLPLSDGNGVIDFAELDLLKSYFGDDAWDATTKQKLMEEMDEDGNGTIEAEEFYKWMVLNASNVGTADEKGTKALQRREERLKLADATIDDHMMELLDEVSSEHAYMHFDQAPSYIYIYIYIYIHTYIYYLHYNIILLLCL